MSSVDEKRPKRCHPTLIIHGGAGAISRANLPRHLYEKYQSSLADYLTSTRRLLDEGSSALDAACHAVSLLEDDPLFNCGRGAVFTVDGKIELEASVMVASLFDCSSNEGAIKRTGAVSGVRNTRHPIRLAREVLLDADKDEGRGPVAGMHCHLNGLDVEKWGWERGIEHKDDDWFWTKRRWDEHKRGLEDLNDSSIFSAFQESLPSQGTVGAVCLDAWGNIAVATSTGGLTNKAPGRVGDTPTVGAGFWAESWQRSPPRRLGDAYLSGPFSPSWVDLLTVVFHKARDYFALPGLSRNTHQDLLLPTTGLSSQQLGPPPPGRTIIAMSGTGNGDSFLRIAAARAAAAICRFSIPNVPLQKAVSAIAGPRGELQKSAGDRWMKTGEGQGGIIGIELQFRDDSSLRRPHVVFDFNCGGMWRAWYAVDSAGREAPKVMVFRDEY